MKVSGIPLANHLLANTAEIIAKKNLLPRLAIILATDESAPRMYIKHKIARAQELGITVQVSQYSQPESAQALSDIQSLNSNPQVHGILIQQPMYPNWLSETYINAVAPSKDVDGFVPFSKFIPATALGVWSMLSEFARLEGFTTTESFLQNKNIVVLGKGRTAGNPIRNLLTQHGFNSTLIDSKTPNPNEVIHAADLVISATGKKHIINAQNLKQDSYLIGIGVGKDTETITGKSITYGDINEKEIEQIAKLYCPTLGGIGPLTIAHLLHNVTQSALES